MGLADFRHHGAAWGLLSSRRAWWPELDQRREGLASAWGGPWNEWVSVCACTTRMYVHVSALRMCVCVYMSVFCASVLSSCGQVHVYAGVCVH